MQQDQQLLKEARPGRVVSTDTGSQEGGEVKDPPETPGTMRRISTQVELGHM